MAIVCLPAPSCQPVVRQQISKHACTCAVAVLSLPLPAITQRAMPIARLLPLIVALAVALAGGTTSAQVQSPAQAPPEAAKATWGDIAFYLAHGEADACYSIEVR